MARSTRRIIITITLIALNVWIWGLAIVLFALRWHSTDHPGPPIYETFPYGELRIGVDASYPPFAVDNGIEMYGLDIEVGRAIGEELGIPVRFINMGYDGLYDAIRADQVDAVISALLVDPSRTDSVRYTRSYFDAGLVLVSNIDSPLSGMEVVAGKRLAYEFGSDADAEARRWSRRIDDFTTMPYELPNYALDAVRLNQADAALVDAVSYGLYMREHPGWESRSVSLTHAGYVVAVRIDRAHQWQEIDSALRILQENGILDAIIKRWL